MPTANPLEQLRRRMLSHASPAAFAAVAEEHRRAGRLAEAIAVCRDGLERYPAYASARVTLGRALLDSGDVTAAVAELEQAVAQAPDNLAATRALDAARAEAPTPPRQAAPTVPADLPLHAGLPGETSSAPAAPLRQPAASAAWPGYDDAWTDAPVPDPLAVGVDGPQEFGLGPDWLPTDPADRPDAAASPPALAGEVASMATPAAEYGVVSLDEPSSDGPPQGDEQAGIWPVPDVDVIATGAPAEAVFSWTLDAPDGTGAQDAACEAASVWGAPTLAAPRVVLGQVDPSWEADALPQTGAAPDPDMSDVPADPGGHGDWSGLLAEPVSDGAAPRSFNGWEASVPTTPAPSAWAATPDGQGVASAFTGSGFWGTPPAAAQPDGVADRPDDGLAVSQPVSPAASAVPEWTTASVADDFAGTPEATGEWTMLAAPPTDTPDATPAPAADEVVTSAIQPAAIGSAAHPADAPDAASGAAAGEEPTPADAPDAATGAAAGEEPTPGHQLWARAVTSALDEVFAHAGHARPDDVASVRPPASPDVGVGRAVTHVAPALPVEDAAQQAEALPPAVGSLQQMLDAVRARRATLHAEMNH